MSGVSSRLVSEYRHALCGQKGERGKRARVSDPEAPSELFCFPLEGQRGRERQARALEMGYCYLFNVTVVVMNHDVCQDLLDISKDICPAVCDDLAKAGVDGITHQPPFPLLMFLYGGKRETCLLLTLCSSTHGK